MKWLFNVFFPPERDIAGPFFFRPLSVLNGVLELQPDNVYVFGQREERAALFVLNGLSPVAEHGILNKKHNITSNKWIP